MKARCFGLGLIYMLTLLVLSLSATLGHVTEEGYRPFARDVLIEPSLVVADVRVAEGAKPRIETKTKRRRAARARTPKEGEVSPETMRRVDELLLLDALRNARR
jgi:hypothetical protein